MHQLDEDGNVLPLPEAPPASAEPAVLAERGHTSWGRISRKALPILRLVRTSSTARSPPSRASSFTGMPVPVGSAVTDRRRTPSFGLSSLVRSSRGSRSDGEPAADWAGVEPYTTRLRSYHGRVLLCLAPHNPVRRAIIALIELPWFDRVVLALICVNCLFLALQQPWTEPLPWAQPLELAFQILFTAEMVMKVLAMGILLPQGAFLRDGWNWIDFAVVVFGWLALLPQFENVSAVRSIRVFRPLRTITRIRGMRVIVQSLIDAVPMMANVVLLFLFALSLFGVVGVQLFMGSLRYRCYESASAAEPVDDAAVCYCGVNAHAWRSAPVVCPEALTAHYRCPAGQLCRQALAPPYNPNHGVTHFDNIGAAVYNIFQALTLEGWVDTTYMLMAGHSDAGGVLFMVVLVGFLAFFVVNLFLAVIFLSFENTRKSVSPEQEAAAAREAAQEAARAAADAAAPHNAAHAVISSARFTQAVTALIVVNTVLMACEYHGMPADLARALELANYVLTGLFGLELLLKLAGLGVARYVADRFNIFDAVVVAVSLVEIVLAQSAVQTPGKLSVLRTFRLMRVFKLARSWTGLQLVLQTVLDSLNSIAYLAGILLLIMFIFALLGMQMFGTIHGDPRVPAVLAETPHTNFNSLAWSMITIFVVISGARPRRALAAPAPRPRRLDARGRAGRGRARRGRARREALARALARAHTRARRAARQARTGTKCSSTRSARCRRARARPRPRTCTSSRSWSWATSC